jgi:glycosyltransferase involved in cell wall biosynthesis
LRPKWQNDFYRIVEKKYLRSVDGFIFNSKTTREAVNRLAGKGRHEIVAYPPTDRFGRAIPQEEIQTRSTQNPLRILFLGNVIERKGLHTLLKAVTCQPSDIRLDVVGSLASEPEYAGKMRRFVMVNELESIVTFHSALDSQPLIDRLRQAHVLIVPSSYEGFGIVYLEGMCFGLPCIGTTKGAAREIIENERTGYLIQPNDHEALAVHIASLAEDRALLAQLSLNARDRYNRQPSWNETAGHLRAFLQGLIG